MTFEIALTLAVIALTLIAFIREWAATEQPYLRMGLDTLTLTPAREFDALIFVDSVSVPTYRLPPSRLR